MTSPTETPDPDTSKAILKAHAEYVQSLHEIAVDAEKQLSEDPAATEVLAALYVRSFLAKFRGFWFKHAGTEAYVCETWPEFPIFSPLDFELLVKYLLQLIDGNSYLLTKKSHDEGIDLQFDERLDLNYQAYATTIVQCKLYRGYVPVSDIRDFFGVMTARTAKGLFITTGLLTSQASQFLPMANGSPYANRLHIIAKDALLRIFEVADELASAVLSSDVNPDDEEHFHEWCSHIDDLQQQAHHMLRSQPIRPSQRSLF